MRLTIAGVHTETGTALKDHAEARMAALKQYFDQVMEVQVAFKAENHHLQVADVTVHASGILLRAEGRGADFYVALDAAAEKLQRQLLKYKGRLENHRARRRDLKDQAALPSTLDFEDAAAPAAALDGALAEFAPHIVRKEVSSLAPMTVDDAVMQMDLLHKPAFLFMNIATRELNMVYREGDHTVRWVAPKQAA